LKLHYEIHDVNQIKGSYICPATNMCYEVTANVVSVCSL